jgi:hypothetical protein
MCRAATSLPVPVSPRISTVESVGATRWIIWRMFCTGALLPTSERNSSTSRDAVAFCRASLPSSGTSCACRKGRSTRPSSRAFRLLRRSGIGWPRPTVMTGGPSLQPSSAFNAGPPAPSHSITADQRSAASAWSPMESGETISQRRPRNTRACETSSAIAPSATTIIAGGSRSSDAASSCPERLGSMCPRQACAWSTLLCPYGSVLLCMPLGDRDAGPRPSGGGAYVNGPGPSLNDWRHISDARGTGG